MNVLHVTEAMAGGILTLSQSLASRQLERGADVSIWFLERPDSPPSQEIAERLPKNVTLRNFSSHRNRGFDYLKIAYAIRRVLLRGEFDAIHLHSSIAGALGRIASLRTKHSPSVFYSPHGFAFLRENTSMLSQRLTRHVESALAPLGGGLILTCRSEETLAKEVLRAPRTYVVQTGIERAAISMKAPARRHGPKQRPVVGMVGRVVHQKAPWRFAQVARELHKHADFIWIGDGDAQNVEKWLGDAPLKVTGWLPPEQLRSEIESLDVLLFPTLWEGMPLSLLQAQAQGVPAVVSNIVGNRDAVLNGETGYVCEDDASLLSATRDLILDPDKRSKMSHAAVQWAREALTDEFLGSQTLEIYRTGRHGS